LPVARPSATPPDFVFRQNGMATDKETESTMSGRIEGVAIARAAERHRRGTVRRFAEGACVVADIQVDAEAVGGRAR
jgi:hypothetical protein